jgi:NADPH:quinone reductase
MKAAQVTAYGPGSPFVINEVETPKPGKGQVLVKVEAAGVIFADVLRRQGGYGPPGRPFPLTMGVEVAGTVAQIGPDVTEVAVGTRVVSSVQGGGYAEYAAVHARGVRALPGRVSARQALVYNTNLQVGYVALHSFGHMQPGESVLVHAAAGGVGSMITQIAKRRGKDNTVIALASSDEKLEFCRKNGADHVINYKKQDYVEAVKQITDNRGVDIVCNGTGGDTLRTDPQVLKRLTGRWLIYGQSGGRGTIDPYSFIYQSITVRPFSIRTLEGTEERIKATRFLDDWLRTEELIEPGHVFKLSEIASAFELIEQQRSCGKIVLIPDP